MQVGLIGLVRRFLELFGQLLDPRLKIALLLTPQLLRRRAFGLFLLEFLSDHLPVVSPFLSALSSALELLAPVLQLFKSVLLIAELGLLLSDSVAQARYLLGAALAQLAF